MSGTQTLRIHLMVATRTLSSPKTVVGYLPSCPLADTSDPNLSDSESKQCQTCAWLAELPSVSSHRYNVATHANVDAQSWHCTLPTPCTPPTGVGHTCTKIRDLSLTFHHRFVPALNLSTGFSSRADWSTLIVIECRES